MDYFVFRRKVFDGDKSLVFFDVLVFVDKTNNLILLAELESGISSEFALGCISLQSLPIVTTIGGK
jgi:hypothetical protein